MYFIQPIISQGLGLDQGFEMNEDSLYQYINGADSVVQSLAQIFGYDYATQLGCGIGDPIALVGLGCEAGRQMP